MGPEKCGNNFFIWLIKCLRTCEIVLRCMPQYLTNMMSTLIPVMTVIMSPYGVTEMSWSFIKMYWGTIFLLNDCYLSNSPISYLFSPNGILVSPRISLTPCWFLPRGVTNLPPQFCIPNGYTDLTTPCPPCYLMTREESIEFSILFYQMWEIF